MRQFSVSYLQETRRGMWQDDRSALAVLELDSRDRVLDVGCGEGGLSRILAEETAGTVIGVDRDRRLVHELEISGIQGDGRRLPVADDAVSLVVCQALLINLKPAAQEAVLDEFKRVANDHVACVEPDNGNVEVDSTVSSESELATRARSRYLRGNVTDVALGADVGTLLEQNGLTDVTVREYQFERTIEPPYDETAVLAATKKASGEGLRARRNTMDGSPEELDDLRTAWRKMGRKTIEQMQAGEYRRREVVPFYVAIGSV